MSGPNGTYHEERAAERARCPRLSHQNWVYAQHSDDLHQAIPLLPDQLDVTCDHAVGVPQGRSVHKPLGSRLVARAPPNRREAVTPGSGRWRDPDSNRALAVHMGPDHVPPSPASRRWDSWDRMGRGDRYHGGTSSRKVNHWSSNQKVAGTIRISPGRGAARLLLRSRTALGTSFPAGSRIRRL